jgi:hypothetical protein
MKLLPNAIEVWCCPNKHDHRIVVSLGGDMIDWRTQELGYVYIRHNGDQYTAVMSKADMIAWLTDPDNIAEQKVVEDAA